MVVADELGDRLGAEASGDVDYGLDDELIGGGVDELGDEPAVDLQVVELEVLEVVEGGKAGAEVVEREQAAELSLSRARSRAHWKLTIAAVSVISTHESPVGSDGWPHL